ncbi:MAG: cation-translocating P-type ATPase [Sedimentisphaerales bacterium]|jgi:Ca2+-transporting ATPase
MILSEGELQNLKGLSEIEALGRLKTDGFNELPSSQKRSIFKIIIEVFREPMFLLLVACGVIYLILGDVGEAVMLLGFVFVVMGITIYQEGKTERAIEALRDLSSPRALVIRDGAQKRIAGREVARGDIIVLREGDRIPADAVLLWGMNLTADESLLTGESVAVHKTPSAKVDMESRRPGGDGLPFLYSGCLVVQGQGIAQVIATGAETEIGKIGKVLRTIEDEQTLLQKETGKVVKTIFIIAVFLCLVVVMVYGLTRGHWLEGILSGLTLAMAILPEEFPVVLTIFLALGAWRISKKGVLTRKVAAIEILGSATILCVDKTGTLTQNRMSVRKIFAGGKFCDVQTDRTFELPEEFHEVVEYGILASKKDPFDPMDRALSELGHKALYNTEHLHNWPLIEEYPLSKEIMALSNAWETPDGRGYIVSTKGAPEAIADLCHLSESERESLVRHINVMASEGLRVLGVAKAYFERQKLPTSQHDFDFYLVGLIGMADPVRGAVPAAIEECHNAGIRVIMITGDYPITACNIAKQIGLRNPDNVITGSELEKLTSEELARLIRTVNIFSRVVPEQKLLIIDALKANGEIVAMTGDGVNDAPALKSAHIGVAMGQRGTDVARESSDLVLLDDDFSSIVAAVRMGRRIFDNLKKATAYIISVHVPIAGVSLIPVLLGWPIILYPVHIVFLELIIDPACSIVFESEPEESDIMSRPPRDPKKSLFARRLLVLSFLQGLFALVVVAVVFRIALGLGQTESAARTLAFTTLVISNICLILTNRSWSRSIIASLSVFNRALAWVIAGAALFLGLVVYVPVLQKLFHFEIMHVGDLLIALLAGVLSVIWFEVVKMFTRKNNAEILKS